MNTDQEVRDFLKKVPAHVLVVLDEAYAEYNVSGQYPDSIGLVNEYKNVIILRTFSKIYGLASLRIGYGIAHADVIRSVNQVREPFNTTGFAQKAALAALKDEQFIADCREANAKGIVYLSAQFDRLQLSYYPAHGNFMMVDVKRPGGQVFDSLLRKGLIVRHDPSWKLPTMIRVTVGSQEQNEKFIGALELALNEVAVEV
jgi:histidinol-phosphate aminotransferase